MRQRFLVLLVVLTVAVGTMVVASGVMFQPLPEHSATAEAGASRPSDSAGSRSKERSALSEKPVETPVQAAEPRAEPDTGPPVEPETGSPAGADEDDEKAPAGEEEAEPEVPGGVTDAEVPSDLGGRYLVRPGTQEAPPGRATYSITVEVEDGLPISTGEFADFVMETLNHEKSWAKDGAVTFARVEKKADFRIILASPGSVDRECAPLQTGGKWSCGTGGKVMVNADRWINNADAFMEAGGDTLTYRRYLVNHEVGHLIGQVHESCTAPGQPAPVMVQQSISLQGCLPNGWAHP